MSAGVRTEFPHRVREVENAWIPMSDGVRLAARIWLPEGAENDPVPAVLEYLPYRKDDGTAHDDSLRHPYFAGCGYASVRVDMRGSGDAGGILEGEYLPQEQADALEVLAWLAAQPWCDGGVGMVGISWGGFNGLQVAALRPPQLKAVITVCSTDDRYADDCHYLGGCLLGSDMLKWASWMLAINAQPPDPRHVGDGWREIWLDRLERTPVYAEQWLAHQTRDAFWRHGSVAEDYSAIECPTLIVGGWADEYTNTVPRLLERLTCPRAALLGPWAHVFPNEGVPGPGAGFLQMAVRWWDRWLKGADNGVEREPALRAWMQEWVPPRESYTTRPGRWIAEEGWPPAGARDRAWAMSADGTLAEDAGAAAAGRLTVCAPQHTGETAGVGCPVGLPDELPADQRADDERSLCFDTAPLTEPLEVLGRPEVRVRVSADRPLAVLAARVCDVAPDGSSLLVSWWMLNLSHRDGDDAPAALEPGRDYDVTLRLKVAGHRFEAGHRIRLALSQAYWPHAWPSPEPVTLTVTSGAGSTLTLPERPPGPLDAELPPLPEAETAAPLSEGPATEPHRRVRTRGTAADGRHEIRDVTERRVAIGPTGTVCESTATDVWLIAEDDPLSAVARCEREMRLAREGWDTRVLTRSVLTADADTFHLTNAVEAYEGDDLVFERRRHVEIPRNGV